MEANKEGGLKSPPYFIINGRIKENLMQRSRSGSQGTVSVSGTAVVTILASDNIRTGGTLYNDGPSTAFVGYSTGLATTTGFPILPGSSIYRDFLNNYTGPVYGRVSSGTAVVRYLYKNV